MERCVRCGLVYVNPRIADFEEIYEKQETMLNYFLDRAATDETAFRFPLSLIERLKPRGSVLDVGCGTGNLLLQLREKGYDCTGVELNRGCVTYGREEKGLDIRQGTVERLDFGGERFDVITILSTLEHVGHPMQTLLRAQSLLKEDGLLLVTVPNFRYIGFRIGKVLRMKTKTLDPTAHLFYFTLATLRAMCEKAGLRMMCGECGWVTSLRAERKVKDLVKRIIFPVSNRLEWGSTITMVLQRA